MIFCQVEKELPEMWLLKDYLKKAYLRYCERFAIKLLKDHGVPQEKIDLYIKGDYSFPPPVDCTGYWTDKDWVDYIDKCGTWSHLNTSDDK